MEAPQINLHRINWQRIFLIGIIIFLLCLNYVQCENQNIATAIYRDWENCRKDRRSCFQNWREIMTQTVQQISSPADRKKIKDALHEISGSMTRIEAERDYIKEAIKELASGIFGFAVGVVSVSCLSFIVSSILSSVLNILNCLGLGLTPSLGIGLGAPSDFCFISAAVLKRLSSFELGCPTVISFGCTIVTGKQIGRAHV